MKSTSRGRPRRVMLALTGGLLAWTAGQARGHATLVTADWLTVTALADGGWRSTLFYRDDFSSWYMHWDARVELWLPPFRRALGWGVYARGAVTDGETRAFFESVWSAGPGIGIQVYPFAPGSLDWLWSPAAELLYPVRVFLEESEVRYWHDEDAARPDHLLRGGVDLYRGRFVNEHTRPVWYELFHETSWRSANEFDPSYRMMVTGTALRVGARVPRGWSAWCSTYGLAELVRSAEADYFWENRVLYGGGLRLAPDLRLVPRWMGPLDRAALSVEYLRAGTYLGRQPLPWTPDQDVRLALSLGIGDFWQ